MKKKEQSINEGLKALETYRTNLNYFRALALNTKQDVLPNILEEEHSIIEQVLKEYQEIKDELGIDFITVIKALKNGIYAKVLKQIRFYGPKDICVYWFEERALLVLAVGARRFVNTPDIFALHMDEYGKFWALTKKELE